MDKSESIKELATALCKAQATMSGAKKNSENPYFHSAYSDLGSVVNAVKEPFADNGLSYAQFPVEDQGRIGIETILMHVSGEWISNSFTVQLTKQDAQGAGSAITYCRRYSLQAVAGIPSEDDDGNNASKGNNQQVTSERARDIKRAEEATEAKKDAEAFDKYMDLIKDATTRDALEIMWKLPDFPRKNDEIIQAVANKAAELTKDGE